MHLGFGRLDKIANHRLQVVFKDPDIMALPIHGVPRGQGARTKHQTEDREGSVQDRGPGQEDPSALGQPRSGH